MTFLTHCRFPYFTFIFIEIRQPSERPAFALKRGQTSFNPRVSLGKRDMISVFATRPVLLKAKKDRVSFCLPLNQCWTKAVAVENQRSGWEKWNTLWIQQKLWSFTGKFILSWCRYLSEGKCLWTPVSRETLTNISGILMLATAQNFKTEQPDVPCGKGICISRLLSCITLQSYLSASHLKWAMTVCTSTCKMGIHVIHRFFAGHFSKVRRKPASTTEIPTAKQMQTWFLPTECLKGKQTNKTPSIFCILRQGCDNRHNELKTKRHQSQSCLTAYCNQTWFKCMLKSLEFWEHDK